MTVTALTMLGHFSFSTYVAPYLVHAGLPERSIGPVLLLNGAMGLVGLVVTGLLADRVPRAVMVVATAVLAACFLVLAVAGGSLVVAVVASSATGLALGSLPVILQAVTLRAAPHAQEQASALNASAFNVGIGGGALLGGLALDRWGTPAAAADRGHAGRCRPADAGPEPPGRRPAAGPAEPHPRPRLSR